MVRVLLIAVLASAFAYAGGSVSVTEQDCQQVLLTLPSYGPFDYLGCKVENGKLTLIGQVSQAALKSEAEHAVSSLKDAREVISQIQVVTASPADEQLRTAVYRAIYSEPALTLYGLLLLPPVHILVNNGVVTLEGKLKDDAERDIAVQSTSRVPGVVSVIDHIQVETGQTAPAISNLKQPTQS